MDKRPSHGKIFQLPEHNWYAIRPKPDGILPVIFLLFGSCALNVLRGPTHFSNVMTHSCEKGQYDPSSSRINFPVPSLAAIKKMKTRYSKSAQPRLIHATLDMFQEKAISFDGMKVSRGCKGTCDGDVNLWGIEGPPNVRNALINLENNTKYTNHLNRKLNEENISIHRIQIEGVHLCLMKKLECVSDSWVNICWRESWKI